MSDNSNIIKEFIELTGAPEEFAQSFLESFDYDVNRAVDSYWENNELLPNESGTPLEKNKVDTLLNDNSTSAIESVTLKYRNFKEEEKGNLTEYQQYIPHSESSVCGDFGAACERAENDNKWLIAYSFKENDIEALKYIRDVWKSNTIRWILNRDFILWAPVTVITKNFYTSQNTLSLVKTCEDYVKRFNVNKVPHIAIHNPITGEIIKHLNKLDESALAGELKQFIRENDHPRTESKRKMVENIFDISDSSSDDEDDDVICFGSKDQHKKEVPEKKIEEKKEIIEIEEDNEKDKEIKNIEKPIESKDKKETVLENRKQEVQKENKNEIKEVTKDDKKEIPKDDKKEIPKDEKEIQKEDKKEVSKEDKKEVPKEVLKENKISVKDKPKEGKAGRVKVTFDKETKILTTYSNYTIGDIKEMIEDEFQRKDISIWVNYPKKMRLDKEKPDSLLKDYKIYPSAVLLIQKEN